MIVDLDNQASTSTWSWRGAGLIVVATLLAYATAYDAGFIWDDDDYVTQNPLLRDPAGLWRIWFHPTELPQYYPLVHTTFWLEFRFFGAEATIYHVVNVVLHALGACLLLRVLQRLAVPGALLAALVFAVHPVHVESVAWITERKNVLSGVCYMLSLLAWLRWLEVPPGQPGSRRWWLIALAWFVGALLSKTVTCSLPAVFLLLSWWRQGRIGQRELIGSLPFFAIGLTLALVTAALERSHVRAEGAEFAFSVADRLLIAGRAPWFYLGSLVWPVNLGFNYERWELDTGSLVQWLYPIATVATLAALFALRGRIGRGPLFAALFFGGSLFPALGFFNVYPMRYSFVADHFQYLASLGPIVCGAALLTGAGRRFGPRFRIGVAAVLVVALASLTLVQARIYQDLETLWTDTIDKNPDSWLARTNLARILMGRGDYEAAIRELETALSIYDASETRGALGIARLDTGDPEAAIVELQRSVELNPEGNFGRAWLGAALHARGDDEAARVELEKALAVREDYDRARVFMGQVLHSLGRSRAALPHLLRAIELNPGAIDAFQTTALVCAAIGENDRALLFAANTLVRDPAGARSRTVFVEVLAVVLPRLGGPRAAGVATEIFGKVSAASALGPRLLAALEGRSPEVAAAVGKAIGLR